MQKWFNTAGPCKPDIHYMLSATERLPEIKQLVAQENYFVIHAPRQVGKEIVGYITKDPLKEGLP